VEKKTRATKQGPPRVSAKLFSFASTEEPLPGGEKQKSQPGIVIQIRLKDPSGASGGKVLTRKNTEFWLTANSSAES
jgi:hypothetical protein